MDTREIYIESTGHFLKPIADLLDDNSISEVLINGHDRIFFERDGKLHFSPEHRFASPEILMAAARNIAEYSGRRIGGDLHSVDARLPENKKNESRSNARVHIIVPPCSKNGICISIRKFRKSTFDLEKLVSGGSMSLEIAEFLRLVVQLHKNTIISGGTGTGKTSLLNALSSAIPKDERIIVIEDSSELQLSAEHHVVYLEARPAAVDGTGQVTIRDLFVDSLRMRPDRIVVGEVRRGEALDLVQSMISGHDGSLTTVHASTPQAAAIRLETLSMMNKDVPIPVYVARKQVSSAIQVIIQIKRFNDGSRRISAVSECLGLDPDKEDNYLIHDIYRFKRTGLDENGMIVGDFVRCGHIPTFTHEAAAQGLSEQIRETEGIFQKTSDE